MWWKLIMAFEAKEGRMFIVFPVMIMEISELAESVLKDSVENTDDLGISIAEDKEMKFIGCRLMLFTEVNSG